MVDEKFSVSSKLHAYQELKSQSDEMAFIA